MSISVFISYAWENDSSQDERVKSFVHWLATYLVKWDMDVQFDMFQNHPGMNLTKFMREGISSSRIVLCVCTRTYIKKMSVVGTGVNTEIKELQKKADSTFVIPVVEEKQPIELPPFFSGKFVSEQNFNVPNGSANQKNLAELLTTIIGQLPNHHKIPSEGKINEYFDGVEKLRLIDKVAQTMSFADSLRETVTFEYARNNGEFEIGFAQESFKTKWSHAASDSIYSYCVEGELFLINQISNFDEIEEPSDIKHSDLKPVKWVTTVKLNDGLVWINSNHRLAVGQILDIHVDSEDDSKNTVSFRYKILPIVNVRDSKQVTNKQ